ncbi:hypothetical protein VQ574_20895 (plasmid) [Stutzerimonas frequens]|uniref:hypothetical protein n=1 Tax=Stutzerimonas frequens TaxID=2968969 RepID=UPI002DBCB054|nr:hypothetical protein [Stutzerimonas frequens]WRW29398.1 hypothetical protein VQ574_20895 [Stutzerimonas frequens]
MDCNHRPNLQHQALIEQRARLISSATRFILDQAPETVAIWCYGINALQPQSPTNDWDFIAFVEDSCSAERLDQLNDFDGLLSSVRRIGTQSLDVQAMRYSDSSACARLVRNEGFCIWHKLANPNQLAA